jgi:D-alanyl-lipoteichoic acid acyltransferase DltB (MBOAT superfamily)
MVVRFPADAGGQLVAPEPMLFQSQFFVLVFLPATLVAYYALAGSARARQWVLIAASLAFYAWWDVRFVPLVVGQIGITWGLALLGARIGRRWPLALGILANLLSLATFKYLDFIVDIVGTLSGLHFRGPALVLPIGISFFSFQLISYLIDRWRGSAPIYPFRPFALFVLLFPHVIAGPIVRHNELIPQFAEDPLGAAMWPRFGAGLVLFTVGFAKKVLLADPLGGVADPLFSLASTQWLDFGQAWTAAIAFTLQLFLDFSAYTEMAIGIALMFGLILPENFRRPYVASDLRAFWRRWHISLSLFFRDYVYIPLGGSRAGPVRFVLATLATMGLCGLWHGAGWTFVAWGLWHGLGLVACRYWQRLGRPLPVMVAWSLTMLFVVIGWVLFRARDFAVASTMLGSMAGAAGFDGRLEAGKYLLAGCLVSALLPSAHEMKDAILRPHRLLAAGAAVLAIVCVLRVGQGAPVSFIYFQF